jgi:hypothetical protein
MSGAKSQMSIVKITKIPFITSKTAEISAGARQIFVKDSLRLVDSVKFSRVSEGLKTANTSLRQKIAILRPLVQVHLDTIPDLRDFVTSQDSVITNLDSLIHAQELFCTAQTQDLRDIIALTNQKYEAQEQITAAVTEQLAISTQETRKEKRGKKFWQVTTAIVTGVALYLAVK